MSPVLVFYHNKRNNYENKLMDLSRLKDISGNDEDFRKYLIESFLRKTPETISLLTNALNSGNYEDFSLIIHKYRTSANYFANNRINTMLSELDNKAKKADMIGFKQLYENFLHLISRLIGELKMYYSQQQKLCETI